MIEISQTNKEPKKQMSISLTKNTEELVDLTFKQISEIIKSLGSNYNFSKSSLIISALHSLAKSNEPIIRIENKCFTIRQCLSPYLQKYEQCNYDLTKMFNQGYLLKILIKATLDVLQYFCLEDTTQAQNMDLLNTLDYHYNNVIYPKLNDDSFFSLTNEKIKKCIVLFHKYYTLLPDMDLNIFSNSLLDKLLESKDFSGLSALKIIDSFNYYKVLKQLQDIINSWSYYFDNIELHPCNTEHSTNEFEDLLSKFDSLMYID